MLRVIQDEVDKRWEELLKRTSEEGDYGTNR